MYNPAWRPLKSLPKFLKQLNKLLNDSWRLLLAIKDIPPQSPAHLKNSLPYDELSLFFPRTFYQFRDNAPPYSRLLPRKTESTNSKRQKMSKITYRFYGSATACPGENLFRAEILGFNKSSKAFAYSLLERSASENLVPKQKDEMEKESAESGKT